MRKSCRGCKVDCGDKGNGKTVPVCVNCARFGDMDMFFRVCIECRGMVDTNECHFISNELPPKSFDDVAKEFGV